MEFQWEISVQGFRSSWWFLNIWLKKFLTITHPMNLLRTKKVEILCEYYFGTGDENRNEFTNE